MPTLPAAGGTSGRLPTADGPRRVADTSGGPVPQLNGVNPLAGVLRNAAVGVDKVATEIRRNQEVSARQNAALAEVRDRNAAQEAAFAVQEKIDSRELTDIDSVNAEYQRRVNAPRAEYLAQAPEQYRPNLSVAFQGTDIGQLGRLRSSFLTSQKVFQEADTNELVEGLKKQASYGDADIPALTEQVAQARRGFGGPEAEKLVRQDVEDIYSNVALRQINTAKTAEELGQLQTVLYDKNSALGAAIGADKRLILDGTISQRASQIKSAIEKDEKDRAKIGKSAVKVFDDAKGSLVPLPPDVMARAISEVSGTPYETQAMAALGTYVDTFRMAQKPVAESAAEFDERDRQQIANGATADQRESLKKQREAVEAVNKQAVAVPLNYAEQRMGFAVAPMDVEMLKTPEGVSQMRGLFEERGTLLATVSDNRGVKVDDAFLKPQEEAAFKQEFESADATGQLAFVKTLYEAAPDPAVFNKLSNQLFKGDNVLTGAAMNANAAWSRTVATPWRGNAEVQTSEQVSQALFQGRLALKSKAVATPDLPVMTREFNSYVGKAFADRSPKERKFLLDNVVAYAASKGDFETDDASVRIREAVDSVIGKPTEYKGSQIIPPQGMESGVFTDKLEGLIKNEAARMIAADPNNPLIDEGFFELLDEGALRVVNDMDGTYRVLNGNLPVMDVDIRKELATPASEATSFGQDALLARGLGVVELGMQAAKPVQEIVTMALPVESVGGLAEPGNLDLDARNVLQNDDGSISTERSFSFEENGLEVLVPTVARDGSRILSEEDAKKQYLETGEHLGKFATPDAATNYAHILHDRQDKVYNSPEKKAAREQDASQPRGIRNNNPGNIEKSKEPWKGKTKSEDSRFEAFKTPEDGVRALAKNLTTFYKKHKLDTIDGIISRWAPPKENKTGAYAAAVAADLGVEPGDIVRVSDPEVLAKLTKAIIKHENGTQPYSDELIASAVSSALKDKG